MSMREKQRLIKHILECSRICSKLKQCFFIDKQCNMMIINWQSVYESVQCRSFYYEIYHEERKILNIKKRKQNESVLLPNKKQKLLEGK